MLKIFQFPYSPKITKTMHNNTIYRKTNSMGVMGKYSTSRIKLQRTEKKPKIFKRTSLSKTRNIQ